MKVPSYRSSIQFSCESLNWLRDSIKFLRDSLLRDSLSRYSLECSRKLIKNSCDSIKLTNVTKNSERELQSLCSGAFRAMVLILFIVSSSVHANTDNGNLGTSTPTNTNCGVNTEHNCGSTGSVDPTVASDSFLPSTQGGNPINLLTGNKYQQEVDYQHATSKLHFSRHYNSQNSDYSFGIGQGWSSTYLTKLYRIGSEGYDVLQANGQRINFRNITSNDAGQQIFKSENPAFGYLETANDQTTWMLPDGRRFSFRGSFLARIDFPGEDSLELFYKNGMLAEVSDEAGRVLLFEYYSPEQKLAEFSDNAIGMQPGYLSKITLPDGSAVRYNYDNKRNLTRAVYDDGTYRQFHYEDETYPNYLTGITERTGVRIATWGYHPDGKAANSSHANGVERIDIEYTAPSDINLYGSTTVLNSLQQESVYKWIANDGNPLLVEASGVGCSTCPKTGVAYSYNTHSQISQILYDTGMRFEYSYDEIGRIASIRELDAYDTVISFVEKQYQGQTILPSRLVLPSVNFGQLHTVDIEYNEELQPTTITEMGYSPERDNTSEFKAISRSSTMAYENGRLIKIDGPRTDVDDVMQFTYDQLGQLTSAKMPSGETYNLENYDNNGRPRNLSVGSKQPIHLEYNAEGQVTKVSSKGQNLLYKYDTEGRLIGLTDTNGKYTQLNYDEAGRLTRVADDSGIANEFIRDTESRIIDRSFYGINGALVRTLNYVFDAKGRIETLNEQSHGSSDGQPHHLSLNMAYDEFDRPKSIKSSESRETIDIAHGPFGKLVSMGNSQVGYHESHFDGKSQNIGYTDPRNNRTTYLKDDFGRVVYYSNPDSGQLYYEYDANGNRTSKKNPDGQITSYQWDAADRLTRMDSPDGITTFRYHANNGRLVETVFPGGRELFSYNNEQQLTSHVRHIDKQRFETTYQYNLTGQLDQKTLPDGQVLRFHYHTEGANSGTLKAITRSRLMGLSQELLVGEIDLDMRNGRTGYTHYNGISTEYKYKSNGQIDSVSVSNTLKMEYEYDEFGNITGVTLDNAHQQYQYFAGNLVSANTQLGEFEYVYDNNDNRVESKEAIQFQETRHTQYEYASPGEGNRLKSQIDLATRDSKNYLFNEQGSPLKTDEYEYKYNSDQRPIEVRKNGKLAASYTYNSFGERIRKVVYNNSGNKVTYFLYDGNTLTGEYREDGEAYSQYIYLQDITPIVKLERTRAFAIHTDQLGVPRRMSDDAGQLVWDADYTPYGKAFVSLEKNKLDLRLPGQYHDEETGTHYNYFRDYDPQTGRYITVDPIGLKGGTNFYAYLSANPLAGSDQLGLFPTFSGGMTSITHEEYDRLKSYSDAENGKEFFNYLFELKPHPAFKDIADYLGSFRSIGKRWFFNKFLAPGMMSGIAGIACGADGNSIYGIPDLNILIEGAYQTRGAAVGAVRWVGETLYGMLQLGADTVVLGLDLTVGLPRDLVQMLFPDVEYPEWYPSFRDGVETIENVVEMGVAIYNEPGLIWDGLTEPYVTAWAEGRYGEAIGRGVMELITLPVGIVKVGQSAKIRQLLVAAKRADLAQAGEFKRLAAALVEDARRGWPNNIDKLGSVLDDARASGTLDDFLEGASLTPTEIQKLIDAGKLSPDEAARLSGNAPIAGATAIDIATDSGKGFFDEIPGPAPRGKEIENALAKVAPYNNGMQTIDSYPGVDFLVEGKMISMKSVDLADKGVNMPDGLFTKLRNQLNSLDSFRTRLADEGEISRGATIIEDSQVTSSSLDIVVQKGVASESQLLQIDRAREYAESLGLELRIVEIP